MQPARALDSEQEGEKNVAVDKVWGGVKPLVPSDVALVVHPIDRANEGNFWVFRPGFLTQRWGSDLLRYLA